MSLLKRKSLVVNYNDLLNNDELWDKVKKGISFAFPGLGLLMKLTQSLNKFGGLTRDDSENVERVIRAGREQSVDKMSIELDRDQWAGLKGKLDAGPADAEIAFGTGGSTGYRIDVKYK
jgi:hypothetical protein